MRAAALLLCSTLSVATVAAAAQDGGRGRAGSSRSCQLGNEAGGIEHVIYIQFDNTHLRRDLPNVPSDLEQMPHLLEQRGHQPPGSISCATLPLTGGGPADCAEPFVSGTAGGESGHALDGPGRLGAGDLVRSRMGASSGAQHA